MLLWPPPPKSSLREGCNAHSPPLRRSSIRASRTAHATCVADRRGDVVDITPKAALGSGIFNSICSFPKSSLRPASAVTGGQNVRRASRSPSPPQDDVATRLALRSLMRQLDEERRRQQAERRQARSSSKSRGPPRDMATEAASALAPGRWLTDKSIAAVYELLSAGVSDGGVSQAVLLMDPAVGFWLTKEKNRADVEEATAALKIAERDLILCPINDSSCTDCADAGSHWSLLICWRLADSSPPSTKQFSFIYFDSMASSGRNRRQAERLSRRLSLPCLASPVVAGGCAQQTNSFDCGVYVLLFSEIILEAFLAHSRGEHGAVNAAAARLAAVTPREAADHRDLCRRRLLSSCITPPGTPPGSPAHLNSAPAASPRPSSLLPEPLAVLAL